MLKRVVFWLLILIVSIIIFNLALGATISLITREFTQYDFGTITSKFVHIFSGDYPSIIQNISTLFTR